MQYVDFLTDLVLVSSQNKLSALKVHAQFKKDNANYVTMCIELPDKTIITLDLIDILNYAKKVGVIK